jgi:hypothetical protein
MNILTTLDFESIFESLRKGIVPERGIDAFTVGVEKQRGELHRQLEFAAGDVGTIIYNIQVEGARDQSPSVDGHVDSLEISEGLASDLCDNHRLRIGEILGLGNVGDNIVRQCHLHI